MIENTKNLRWEQLEDSVEIVMISPFLRIEVIQYNEPKPGEPALFDGYWAVHLALYLGPNIHPVALMSDRATSKVLARAKAVKMVRKFSRGMAEQAEKLDMLNLEEL